MLQSKYILTACILFVFMLWNCNNTEVTKKTEIKSIILIIGNRSTLADFERNKNFEEYSKVNRFRVSSVSANQQLSQSATLNFSAIAIGKKCNNNSIGLDVDGVAHPNLLELASVKGLSTGLITSGSVVEPLPASFIAHVNKNQPESIALEFLNSPVDFLTGAGLAFFNSRTDGINLIQQLENKGYSVYNETDKVRLSKKTAVLFNDNFPESKYHIMQQSIVQALQSLSGNKAGFLLVIDGTNVLPSVFNTGSSAKKRETDFSHSIESAFDFASQNPGTLVIIATECFASNSLQPKPIRQPEASSASLHTDSSVVYTFGMMPDEFRDISESTDIFDKIVSQLNLDVP